MFVLVVCGRIGDCVGVGDGAGIGFFCGVEKCSVSGSYCWLRYGCGGWIWSEAVDCVSVVSVVVFNIIGERTLEIEFW